MKLRRKLQRNELIWHVHILRTRLKKVSDYDEVKGDTLTGKPKLTQRVAENNVISLDLNFKKIQ